MDGQELRLKQDSSIISVVGIFVSSDAGFAVGYLIVVMNVKTLNTFVSSAIIY
jgi:hypothetical protein